MIGCFFTAYNALGFGLELKAGHHLPAGGRAQLITYLRLSRKDLGLLLFFGPTPEVERVAL